MESAAADPSREARALTHLANKDLALRERVARGRCRWVSKPLDPRTDELSRLEGFKQPGDLGDDQDSGATDHR